MGAPLVWVPENFSALVEDAPAGIEVAVAPADPASDPRLGEVAFVVNGMGRNPFAGLYPQMTSLQVIQTTSAGVDGVIPLMPEGITLCSARGAYGVVAEWVVAAILADHKQFPVLIDQQRAGTWKTQRARRLVGSTVLLLGYGGIAEAVERRLQPFGVEFLRVARHAREGVETLAALPELLPRSDIVVLLVPLTAETNGLVDAAFLAQLPDDALIVNAARGKVIDTDALISEAATGRLRAVLDVTDPEPLPEGHPLWSTPNVFVTPHIAGGGLARPEVERFIRTQLERFATGAPLANVVTEGY
jgi:phosphoglycerate dehydrogenase-like enzyme